jgi:hypothetical protein
MKTINFIPLIAGICLLFAACEKDEPANNNNNNNNNNSNNGNPVVAVDSGRSSIGFTTSPAYYGSSVYNVANTTTTYAFSQSAAGVRQVQVKAVETSGNASRTVFLFMVMPETASTASANINIDFANAPTNPYTARMTLSHRVDTVLSRDYNSVTGNVTISRLTDVDVRGTFQGTVADSLGNVLTVSGGTFEGRF